VADGSKLFGGHATFSLFLSGTIRKSGEFRRGPLAAAGPSRPRVERLGIMFREI